MDEFEFDCIPKFINFASETENTNAHEKSAYFNAVNLKTPLKAPLPESKSDQDARDVGPIDINFSEIDKENELPSLQNEEPKKDPFKAAVAADVQPAVAGLSKLALFNPSASRVAEKARRRSQQIGVSEKTTPLKPAAFNTGLRNYKAPTGKTPSKPLTLPAPFPFRRSNSKCRDTAPGLDPRVRASVDRLSAPKKRVVENSPNPQVPQKLPARVAAVVERLSSPLKRSNSIISNTSAASRAPIITRRQIPSVAAPVEKPSPFKRSNSIISNNSTASRAVPPITRRQIPSVAATVEKPTSSVRRSNSVISRISTAEKTTPLKPAAFSMELRSSKVATAKTIPAKPSTQPAPFPFRRSNSKCRDTAPGLDLRVRASVDRLSARKKRGVENSNR